MRFSGNGSRHWPKQKVEYGKKYFYIICFLWTLQKKNTDK